MLVFSLLSVVLGLVPHRRKFFYRQVVLHSPLGFGMMFLISVFFITSLDGGQVTIYDLNCSH